MPRPRVLLSVHDVAPPFLASIQEIIGLLREWGYPLPALLVVPYYHRRYDLRFLRDFTNAVQAWLSAGSELILHGYVHLDDTPATGTLNRLKARFLTAGEGEFLSLDEHEARARLTAGLRTLETCFGQRPVGFVAPAWLQGEPVVSALEAVNLGFYETHTSLVRLQPPKTTSSLVVNWATRTTARRWASVAYSDALACSSVLPRCDWLRLAIHPPDVRFPETRKALVRLLTRLHETHVPARYQDWLDEA